MLKHKSYNKKLVYLVLVALTLFSCVKRDNDPVETQDVTFTAVEINPDAGLKSTLDYNCLAELSPDYAKIVITGFVDPFYPKVFRLDGQMYTQSIKLAPGTYTVEQFLVMDDMGTPDDLTGDQIYMAVPESGSSFAAYTDPDVTFTFTVSAFIKTEIAVQVLCFQPQIYDYFGFDWFAITELVIREQCFFGDLCVDPDDYTGSMYDADQPPIGCQVDMPAIIQVIVKRNGVAVPYSPFTNATVAANFGAGAPLCVQYADNLSVTGENFTFELKVLVNTAPGEFSFQTFDTFSCIDGTMIPSGDDGVIDIAIGTCSPDADYIYTWPLP